jgi:hypothetical protein
MAVPYTFGTATASIPLSNLDSNFATTITLGNTAIQLGNTVTTLNNMTLANVTVSSGSVTLTNITATTANVTTANISGTTTLTNLTASTALALDASKNIASVTNTGTGNNVLSASPTLTGTMAGASLSLSSLTSGRVPYATTSGLLTDSANMLFDGTTFTVASRGIAKASMPAGSVLQVVNATNTTQTSTSTSALTDTSLTASITPTSSTSKILIFLSQAYRKDFSDTSLILNLFRNAADLGQIFYRPGNTGTSATQTGVVAYTYLDSPTTTSSVTYTTKFGSQNNAASVTINFNGDSSSITLMEIAA